MQAGSNPSVITLGEGLIRLYPGEGHSLESAPSWRVSVGGAEANVAVLLARLGFPTTWVSRLPRTPLGRRIAAALRAAGVDVDSIVWSSTGRVGIYWTETGITPEDVQVWYDREGSTFFSMTPEDLPLDRFPEHRLIHFTGITPALGPGPQAVVAAALERAAAAGIEVSLDVNFRSRLWSADQARETLVRLFRDRVHLVICSRRDARDVFGCRDDESALRWLGDVFGARVPVLTRGSEGAIARQDGERVEVPAYGGRVVDRIGRGDAFAAGVISGYLAGDVALGIRRGCALAALAQARWGDQPWVDADQLSGLILAGPGDRR